MSTTEPAPVLDASSPAQTEPAVAPPRPSERRHRPRGGRLLGKLIGLGVSAVVLFIVVRRVDLDRAKAVLAGADVQLVIWSSAIVIPIIVLTALRFLWIAPRGALPGMGEAIRLTLVANALNVLLPAKLGDLSKSFFLVKRASVSMGVAVSIIVMERVYDLFGLLSLCLLGWLLGYTKMASVSPVVFIVLAGVWAMSVLVLSSERGAVALCNGIRRVVGKGRLSKLADIADGWPELLRLTRGRRLWLALYSLGFWLVHLTQLWLFFVAVHADVPFMPAATLSALVLIAGLLPLTFAGLGAREAAFVALFAAYCPPETALAAAVLFLSRLVLPQIVALPYLIRYGMLTAERRRGRLRYDGTRNGS